MTDLQNRLVGIVGRKGSGKSTRVATLLKYAPRILVWDPMEEYQDALPDSVSDSIDDLYEYFNQADAQPTFACSYSPGGDLPDEFEEVCRLVNDFGRVLFCVEEAPLVCKAGWVSPVFGKIIRTGRHHGIDLLWTAQRASEVSRTLTSATDDWILFSQTEPRDLDAIAERCGRDIADRVANLGLHEFFTWDAIARGIVENSPRLLKRDFNSRLTRPDRGDSKS